MYKYDIEKFVWSSLYWFVFIGFCLIGKFTDWNSIGIGFITIKALFAYSVLFWLWRWMGTMGAMFIPHQDRLLGRIIGILVYFTGTLVVSHIVDLYMFGIYIPMVSKVILAILVTLVSNRQANAEERKKKQKELGNKEEGLEAEEAL